MTREIKFRAWEFNYKTKEWKLNYNPNITDCECFGEYSLVDLNKALKNGGDADWDGDCEYKDPDGNIINKEETKTIFLQFTGLKDKNGVEIYEGDILDYEGYNKYEVYFMNGKFMACNELGHDINNYYYNKVKVIGNIYENPELLTNKN